MIARAANTPTLRVDCWAEAPGLVGWYERNGFIRTATFETHGWRGQVLERSLLMD